MKITHLYSTPHERMVSADTVSGGERVGLSLSGERRQTFRGFGGCFNELGWKALCEAKPEEREKFLDELFCTDGCGFNFGRVPIGANDFSIEWYSCDEVDGDLELEHFNIERDKKYTLPFIREAAKRVGDDFFVFGSPWSPPTWMKTKKVYNFGTMRMEDDILRCYAEYFVRFVKAYAEEGIDVRQIYVQNEPMADQKFPSCKWTGDDMKLFIGKYLGPAMERAGLDTELWLGTINGPFMDYAITGAGAMGGVGSPQLLGEFYDQWANNVLTDPDASKYIKGVGLQWGGKHILELIDICFPHLPIMLTESECGDGSNSWAGAQYIFRQLWMYMRHRCERFTYWNIALPEDNSSSWGWGQNSLAHVHSDGSVEYTPEFYIFKHFAAFVKPGATVLGTVGEWTGNSIAFENPDGSIVLVVGSNMQRDRELVFEHNGERFTAKIAADSVNTFIIS